MIKINYLLKETDIFSFFSYIWTAKKHKEKKHIFTILSNQQSCRFIH